MDTSRLATAVVLAAVGAALWVVFVRRVPERTADGTIVGKGYVAGGAYTQIPVGADRAVSAPNTIAIADANAFELRLDGIPGLVRASFNTVKGRQFAVGQRVRVRLVRRGLPPLWSRLLIVDMTPADSAGA